MKLNLVKTLLAMLLLVPAVSFGDNLKMLEDGPSKADANDVRIKAEDVLAALVDVNGSGITACETKTGVAFSEMSQADVDASEFEYCLLLTAATKDAENALKTLLPVGTRIAGVYVTSKYIGVITIQ